MELHIADFIHTFILLAGFIGILFKFRKDISNEIKSASNDIEVRMDKRFDAMEARLDKRFDAIERRLERIDQNHIDHLASHAVPKKDGGDIQ